MQLASIPRIHVTGEIMSSKDRLISLYHTFLGKVYEDLLVALVESHKNPDVRHNSSCIGNFFTLFGFSGLLDCAGLDSQYALN